MIFVIKNLKYDTDKMELISKKIKYTYEWKMPFTETRMISYGKNVRLYKTQKGRWFLTYDSDYVHNGKVLEEAEVKSLLMQYDLIKYEELFGELEEG
jgi:hypothetical protein